MEKYIPWIIIGVIVLVIIILVISIVNIYNSLVKLRNRVKNAFSQIDVQLTRRFDLIPNLVETVKGYTKHEESIMGEFARARSLYDRARAGNSVNGLAEADNALTTTLGKLMVVTENYPELKADKNFAQMMEDLKDTENKISFVRQSYNDVVLSYNNYREVFPKNMIANSFGFKEAEFYKASEEQRSNVKVQF
ncbi:MAG: LemA family protein [Bacilli bacterium]|nr:LemA family protein [Bacilli bacterium]